MSSGRTVSELIADTLAGLHQPASNYTRYSQSSILQALNLGNLEIAERTKCMHAWGIIIIRAGYSQYLPPSDMLTPKDAFFYQSPDSYIHLTQDGWKTRAWLDRHQAGWRIQESDPYYAYIGDSSGNLRKLGFAPVPKTNGTSYTVSPDTGVVISVTGMTTTGNITGINGAASATVCTDGAGRTLSSLGITVGMVALNVTDSSQGQISDVTGSTFTVTLTGGTNNTWAIGDNFTVLAGEYGVVTSIEGDEQYVFTSDVGELVSISALTGNVYLEYYRKPLELIYDTQYPEIPQTLHQYLPEYAIWWLKRRASQGSNDLNEAMVAKAAFDQKIPPVKHVEVERVEHSRIRFNW